VGMESTVNCYRRSFPILLDAPWPSFELFTAIFSGRNITFSRHDLNNLQRHLAVIFELFATPSSSNL
jgi:hypothetical protein